MNGKAQAFLKRQVTISATVLLQVPSTVQTTKPVREDLLKKEVFFGKVLNGGRGDISSRGVN